MTSASAPQGRLPPRADSALSGLEIESCALERSASPVVPPKVRPNPASGLTAALGTYDANGLTVTFDCAVAVSKGKPRAPTANAVIRREVNTSPPRLFVGWVRHGLGQR